MNIVLPRRTDLALAVLHALAAAGGRMGGAELADATETTPAYLPQVVAPLIRGGWIKSIRGPGGGYRLTETAWDARLLEVIEATQGPVADNRCILRDAPCPGTNQCMVHAVWKEARQVLVHGLTRTPVLAAEEGGSQ